MPTAPRARLTQMPGAAANWQECPTISELTIGPHSSSWPGACRGKEFSRRPDLRRLLAIGRHAAGLHRDKRRQKPASMAESPRRRPRILMARLDKILDNEPRAAQATEQF